MLTRPRISYRRHSFEPIEALLDIAGSLMALPVAADGEPTSASRIRPSSESSTMCHHSKLNGTAFGIHDWLNYLWDQAAMCRKLVEQADDPFIKTELLSLASVCEEIADNIEDHLTGGSDHWPRGPLSRLS